MAAFALQGQSGVVEAKIVWLKIFTIGLCPETVCLPLAWMINFKTSSIALPKLPSACLTGLSAASSSGLPLLWAALDSSLFLKHAVPLPSLLRILSPALPQPQGLWHLTFLPSGWFLSHFSALLRTPYCHHQWPPPPGCEPSPTVRVGASWVSCMLSPEPSLEQSTQ